MKKIVTILLLMYASHSIAMGSVVLQQDRLLINESAKRTTLGVENLSQDTTYLVKSWLSDQSNHSINEFVVTPPLFVVHPGGVKNLEIWKLKSSLPSDRESLFYLYEKAIPSVKNEHFASKTVSVATGNRIKLIYRPSAITAPNQSTPNELIFIEKGGSIIIENPTSYYIDISKINLPDVDAEPCMVPPKESIAIKIGVNRKNSMVEYYIINSQGEEKGPYRKKIIQY